MFKSIRIEGFQCHKDTYLEFHDGVNILIGFSDSGKTAILRAISFVIKNKPSGNAFISTWAEYARVEIQTEKDTIVRKKGKNINIYTLNNLEFTAMGTEVPEEIQKALNMSNINIQKQLDQPFLISETSGNVASHFNKVAKLDSIDTGLQNINSDINQLNSTIGKEAVKDKPATGLIKQINEKQEELVSFAYLEKFEEELVVLEELDKQLFTALQKEMKLETLFVDACEIDKKITKDFEILKLEKPVDDILKLYDTKTVLLSEEEKLLTLLDDLTELDGSIKDQQILTELENPVNDLLGLYDKLYTAENDDEKLTETLSILSGINLAIEKKSAFIAVVEIEFKEGMGDTCPLCNSKLK